MAIGHVLCSLCAVRWCRFALVCFFCWLSQLAVEQVFLFLTLFGSSAATAVVAVAKRTLLPVHPGS